MAGIAYEPVGYLLRDVLHLGPAQSALFIAVMTLPLTFKPFFGLLTDFFPFQGKRRVPHVLAVSLMTVFCWWLLALTPQYRYWPTLTLLMVVNVGFVLSDLVCDGLMVENGQQDGKTGQYQAVQIGTLYATLILTGIGGGWLVAHATYKLIFILAGLFPLLTATSALLLEDKNVGDRATVHTHAWSGVKALFANQSVRALAGVILLMNFAPFLGSAQFFYQTSALKLSPAFIGLLTTMGGISGVVGAAIFGKYAVNSGAIARIARLSITVGASLTFLNLFYTGPFTVVLLTILFGFTGVIFRLAWMDIAARACPKGAEATAFAAFMAVFNIAAAVSNTVGGALYEKISLTRSPYVALTVLTLIGTGCTLFCWPLYDRALSAQQ